MSGYEKGLSREYTRQAGLESTAKQKKPRNSITDHTSTANQHVTVIWGHNDLHTTSRSNPQRTPSHRRVRTGHCSNKTPSTHGD